MNKVKNVDLEKLEKLFEEITGNKAPPRKETEIKELTIDELKALMDKDQLDHDEVVAILHHVSIHLDDNMSSLSAAMVTDVGEGYKCGGGVRGNPALAAMGVMVLLKKVIAAV